MAGMHCFVFSLLAPSYNSVTRKSPSLIIVSSIPSSRPSKTTHRKNYLRPKILKTIPKPYPPVLPLLPQQPEPLPQPILCPQSPEEVDIPSDTTHSKDISATTVAEADNLEHLQVSEATAEKADNLKELQVSEATAQNSGVSGNVSAADIFKYGGIYLVGAFVFQSICSVWFLANYHSNQMDRDSEINGNQKKEFLFNGNGKTMPVTGASNVLYLQDQFEMEKKINEIKLLAREARRIEEMKKEEEEIGDPESDDEFPVSSHRLGIEKEIATRLLKLQNRINSNKDSSAALQINILGNSTKSAGGAASNNSKNVNQGNEALVFKKKLKYKNPSTKPTKTPKGFPGTRDHRASDAKKRNSAVRGTVQVNGRDANDHAEILYEDKQANQQDVETEQCVSSFPLEGGRLVDDKSNAKNLEEKMEIPEMKTEAGAKTKNTNNGGVLKISSGKSAPEVIQSRELQTQNSKGSVEENQDSGSIFEKDNGQSINGSSRHGLAKKNSEANRVKVKQANTKTDMWWLNLHYVLVILMQRASDGGQKGLYSLKFTSKEQDQGDDSYTVAFEDHTDANNFCFLLETFFEDLGDFSAAAVPMSIQELNEEITSHANKVVVVKKRQLQLYAGQPLTDVEMALRSLIEQDQNVP